MSTDPKDALKPRQLVRWPELRRLVARSRAQIWRDERAGKFPKRVRIGPNAVGWFADEIAAFQEKLPRVELGEGAKP